MAETPIQTPVARSGTRSNPLYILRRVREKRLLRGEKGLIEAQCIGTRATACQGPERTP